MTNNLTSKKIAILGFGLEGKSLLKFLKKSPRFKKSDVSVLDKKLDKNYLKNLEQFDLVFRSPGVPYNSPEIQKAVKKGVKFSSATQLFFEEIRKTVRRGSPQVIGITGTKGKGTTSTLLYKILKACDKNTYLAGNIGKPAIEILPKLKNNSVVILELSSFQLQDLTQSPDIAVFLGIFPDHLDAHKNFREYFNAKANIAKWQKKNDKIFYFSDDKYSKLTAQKSPGKKFPIDLSFSNSRELENKIKSVIKIPGTHNLKNAIMAATVALSLGCPKEKIIKAIKNFRGLEHRLEFVRSINVNQFREVRPPKINRQYLGGRTSKTLIKFYNDSASTNPQTAAAAIHAFSEPKILIAGGKDKNLNYSPLAKALKNSNTKMVILFGENKQKIAKAISVNSNRQIVIRKVKNLNKAINLSYKTAKSLITNYQLPITVIFSPASASFDMFKDYKERGEKIKKIVKKLK
ncbi:MAG: UDP-N-acetylmuramoyl-L-alanine--D-glutamate ligase [bacterium]|nr:UDP-N-acetylmuramoyl-L-alanine--D-glutamate ligase [bacterium]